MKQNNMLAMILAGGRGSRLHELTNKVAKPAVSYGGKYRIIDFPLSNCANSGINVVGVLTQYESILLNSYVAAGRRWGLDAKESGVFVLPPREKADANLDVYRGTADAISQNIDFIDTYSPEYLLVLSGDHIYKMNYDKMLQEHKDNGADATIAVIEVPMKEASRFGIMNTDDENRIIEFEEKPEHPKSNLASMGIYIFNWDILKKYLIEDEADPNSENDFGNNIIPNLLKDGRKMYAYHFAGYWKDVGTISSLWEANMEVLDPEQNTTFHDNYLDVDYDLSKVMFIATANDISTIAPPLRDRMEMIEVSGYLMEEKIEIAKRHLIPKQLVNHGLKAEQIEFTDDILNFIIDKYTRESGVRGLDKTLAKIMRQVAKNVALDSSFTIKPTKATVEEYLGTPIFTREEYQGNELPGVVTGLAWTAVGGEILYVESSISKGKGVLTMTGSLGDVMKESATLALEYIKSHAEELGIQPSAVEEHNVHIHVPAGAVPKDGPSAGITMVTSLASSLTGRKVKKALAMTGEITLRGKVLPVGGIREKILAAKRAGIKEIILCRENKKDIDEIKKEYVKGIKFHFVDHIREVLDIALI